MLTITCLRGILWTVGFADPGTALDVLEGIEQFMEKEGINNLAELVGVARRRTTTG